MEKTLSESLSQLDKTISKVEVNLFEKLNLNEEQRKLVFEQFNLISEALTEVNNSKKELNKKLWDLANKI